MLIKLFAGMIKYACNNLEGKLELSRASSALGVNDIVIETMLEMFEDIKMIKILERNENFYILKYLEQNYKDKQIIIFSCSKREKNILEKENICYNFVEL